MPLHVGRRLVAVATATVLASALGAPRVGAKVDGLMPRAADAPTWSDEFDGAAGTRPNRSKWTFDTGGRWQNGTELQQYTDRPANAAHDGKGNLRITARRETYTGRDGVRRRYTSARITTHGRFSFRYGKVEARLKIPVRSGLLPAFWTLGTDVHSAGWPASGEIDVMEVPGSDRWGETGSVQYHLHGPGGSKGALIRPPDGIHAQWHTYGAVWTRNAVRFTFDGRVRRTITRAQFGRGWRAFRKRHFLILNIAVGNSWTGAPRRAERFPATMLVDWVRYHRRP
jgi:beta-glucanase (GH16 family)